MSSLILLADATKATVNLTIDPVAAFAAIISLASFIVSIIAIRRDRAKIHITIRKGWLLVNPAPGYKAKTPYYSVSVANSGTRPVTIGSVGGQGLKTNSGFIFSDSMIHGSQELTQGKSMTCLMEMSLFEKHESEEGVAHIYASTLTGKTFIKPTAPFYSRVFYWGIRKVKAVGEKKAKKKQT